MVTAAQMVWYHSGTGDLGGARGSAIGSNVSIANLFDRVKGIELREGDVEYRCVYIRNDSTTDDDNLLDPEIYVTEPSGGSQGTTVPQTAIDIAMDEAGINNTAQTIQNEDTAPTGTYHFASAREIANFRGSQTRQSLVAFVSGVILAGVESDAQINKYGYVQKTGSWAGPAEALLPDNTLSGPVSGLTKSQTRVIASLRQETLAIYDIPYTGVEDLPLPASSLRTLTLPDNHGITWPAAVAYFPSGGKLLVSSAHDGYIFDYDETNGELSNVVSTGYGNNDDGTPLNIRGAYMLSDTKLLILDLNGNVFSLDVATDKTLSNRVQLKKDTYGGTSDSGGMTYVGNRFIIDDGTDIIRDYLFSETGNLMNFKEGKQSTLESLNSTISPSDLPNGQHIPIWIRRTVYSTASGGAKDDDGTTISITGDTGE